jgi:DNA polymerase III subunit gamma/tau
MLLPEVDGSAAATLQRLERLERRMSIAGEHAGRPVAEAPVAPAAPAPAVERPAAVAPPAEREPSSAASREYVRPSRRSSAPAVAAPPASVAPAAPAGPAAPAPAADDWPVTTPPGSGAARPAAAAPAPTAPRPGPTAGEPDIPLPPEPSDDEDWPHPAQPAAARTAAARVDQPRPSSDAPRAAAESSPAPRGGEPTPVVSAQPESAADGELTTTDVRRVWTELLAVVKRHKRTTEALLKSAQVHDLANGVLTLAATSPALAKMLGDDLNKDVIRESLLQLLGVRWKVQVVVEGAGAPAGRKVAPEAAREAARQAQAAEERELLAQHAAEGARPAEEQAPAVDPEQAALNLLRAQLGARPVDD